MKNDSVSVAERFGWRNNRAKPGKTRQIPKTKPAKIWSVGEEIKRRRFVWKELLAFHRREWKKRQWLVSTCRRQPARRGFASSAGRRSRDSACTRAASCAANCSPIQQVSLSSTKTKRRKELPQNWKALLTKIIINGSNFIWLLIRLSQ